MDDDTIIGAAPEQDHAHAEAPLHEAPPDLVTEGSRFGRRRFLRVLGLGTLAVVPLPVLPEVMRAAGVADGPPAPARGLAEPARTRDGRIRQWTMVIDLRKCDGCQSTG